MPRLPIRFASLLCMAALLSSACRTPGATRRPHILLVVIDALRVTHLGCYGYERPTSPAIDRLAREGLLFQNAVSVGGNTPTAMAAVFTGHNAHFDFDAPWGEVPFGMDRFRRDPDTLGLPESMTTIAEYLSAGGYRTAGFITNPHLKSTFRMDQGFHHYEEIFNEEGLPYGRADQVAARVLPYLEGVNWDLPSFLYIHFMDTHGPYRRPAPDYFDSDGHGSETHYERFQRWESLRDFKGTDREADLDYMVAAYDTSVRHVDQFLGHVLQFYRDRNLMDDTIILLTADHGDEFLEHGGTTHKGTLFDEIVHIPLVASVPGARTGRRIESLVRNFDVAPTILDYAGLREETDHMEAASLRDLVDGRAGQKARTAYASFPRLRMIRTERFKLLRHSDGRESLFDLAVDPGERRDLIGTGSPGVDTLRNLAALRTLLDETVRRLEAQGAAGGTGDRQAPDLDEKTRDQLEALGYIE